MIYRTGMRLDRYLCAACVCVFTALIIIGAAVGIKAMTAVEQESVGTFIGSYVTTENEEFWGGGDRHLRVRNTSSGEAYIRCTPVYTVRDSENRVCDAILRDEEILKINTKDWVKIGSYYYCRKPTAGGKYTPFLIEDCAEKTSDGNSIELTVLTSAIDASAGDALFAQWGVSADADGEIEARE